MNADLLKPLKYKALQKVFLIQLCDKAGFCWWITVMWLSQRLSKTVKNEVISKTKCKYYWMLEHFSSHISGWIFSSLCDIYMHRDENKMHKLSFSPYPSKNELVNQEG